MGESTFPSEVKLDCTENRENTDSKEKPVFLAGDAALVVTSVPIYSLGESLDRRAAGVLMQVPLAQ